MKKRIIKKLFGILLEGCEKKHPLYIVDKRLREAVLGERTWTPHERWECWSECYYMYKTIKAFDYKNWEKKLSYFDSFDSIYKKVRRAEKMYELRERKKEFSKNREAVFYLCSVHNKPAEDHKNLQGKVYIDRYWRSKIPGEYYYAVLSYIRNRKIMTVQEVMRKPYWLTTRPYCMHYFIPIPKEDIKTVLKSSPKKMQEIYGEKNKVRDYKNEYYSVRKNVYQYLDKLHPCKEFKEKERRLIR